MSTHAPSADLSRVFDLAAEYHAAVAQGRAPDLNALCRESPHLLPAVQSVLRAGEQVASARHVPEPPPPAGPSALPARYELGEKIGEGGMGVVYAGRDTSLDRDVAVKLLRPDRPVDAAAVRRFTDEAKVTAQLQHPGIPAVHELGTLADGRPFLAMKLIRGNTLAALLKERGHGSGKWLGVFESICQAVGAAHAAGVIHRDLKPANVMVGAFGEVQVMDWGLAKRVAPSPRGVPVGGEGDGAAPHDPYADPNSTVVTPHSEDTDRTNPYAAGDTDDDSTKAGTVLGTPAYMAPEQARGQVAAIDRRADVFALGAILCELLTGKPPRAGKVADVIAAAAVGDLDQANALLDACGADPVLVALCRRCLTGNPAARPPDASEVAVAVANYRSESEARAKRAEVEKAEATVQATETRKRQRVVVWASGVTLVILLAGLGVSLWQMNRAIDAEGQATASEGRMREERDAKVMALAAETEAKKGAERNLQYSRKSNGILRSVFTALDPDARYQTLADLRSALRLNLLQAAREVDAAGIGDPLEVAAVQNALATSLFGLGETALAIEVFEKALVTYEGQFGRDHHTTLTVLNNLGAAHNQSGHPEQAIPLLEEVVRVRTATVGPDDPSTLTARHNLAAYYSAVGRIQESLAIAEEVYERRVKVLGADHRETLSSQSSLATSYREVGQPAKALPLSEAALKRRRASLGASHPDTLVGMNNLALIYKALGRPDKALPLLEEALRHKREKLGPDHPDTLLGLNNLAVGHEDAGQPLMALPLYEQVVRAYQVKFGPDHPATLTALTNLAQCNMNTGKPKVAIPLAEEVWKGRKARFGPDHPDTLLALNNLGEAYSRDDQPEKARPLLEQAVERTTAKLGEDHPLTLTAQNNLSVCYFKLGQRDKALPLMEEVVERRKRTIGPDHPDTLSSLSSLAVGYKQAGRPERAVRLHEETLRTLRAKLGDEHPLTQTAVHNLALAYHDANRLEDALPLYEEALKHRRARLGSDHADTLASMNNLAMGYVDSGRYDRAVPLLEEAVRRKKETRGADHPDALLSVANLAVAYCGAKAGDKAVPLFREYLAARRKQLPKDDPRLASTLAQVGRHLLGCGQFAAAEEVFREGLAIRQAKEPDAWTTFNTQYQLGWALLGQRKYADAEPVLVAGYEGMKAREKEVPPAAASRIPEALDRLVELYTATGQPDEVKRYRQLRATYPTAREVLPPPRAEK